MGSGRRRHRHADLGHARPHDERAVDGGDRRISAGSIEQDRQRRAIKGVVITSRQGQRLLRRRRPGRDGGGQRGGEGAEASAARFNGVMDSSHTALRKLETCGKPVAAAINGLALGGGLEVTLACHYRVVADNPKIQLGLPEAKVGLLPGGGGTQRLPRLIGAQAALPLMLQGKSLDPQEALAQGIVHEVVPADELVADAKTWIKATPECGAALGQEGLSHSRRRAVLSPAGSQVFIMGNAMLRKQTYDNYPAQQFIMSCVYEGLRCRSTRRCGSRRAISPSC